MLRRVEVEFTETTEAVGKSGLADLGIRLAGALQSLAGDDYCASISQLAVLPYSQGIYYSMERKRRIWSISTLNDECYEKMVLALTDVVSRTGSALGGRFAADTLVSRISLCSERDDREFVRRYFMSGADERRAQIAFRTPCILGTSERGALFPDISNILLSMYKKGQRLLPIAQRLTSSEIASLAYVSSYAVESASLILDRRECLGYTGRLSCTLSGSLSERNICRMLFAYAAYVGIGSGCDQGAGLVDIELI